MVNGVNLCPIYRNIDPFNFSKSSRYAAVVNEQMNLIEMVNLCPIYGS